MYNVGDSLKQRVKENKPNCFKKKNKEKEKSKEALICF